MRTAIFLSLVALPFATMACSVVDDGAAPSSEDELTGKESIRVYAANADGALRAVKLETLAKGSLPKLAPAASVDDAALETAYVAAEAARKRALTKASRSANGAARAEDGSLRVRAYHMGWLGTDQTGVAFPSQLGRIGEVEGFRVVLRTDDPEAVKNIAASKSADFRNIVPFAIPPVGDFWVEDQGELDQDGNVSVPATVEDVDGLVSATLRARILRFYPKAKLSMDAATFQSDLAKYPLAIIGMAANVAKNRTQLALASLAVARKSKFRVNFSYVEGGNMLVGRRANGEPYALVGRDSLESTRFVLERELGRAVSDAELGETIAADVGVAPEHLFPVEEPGDFHLDMRMALLGPETVLLDDSAAVVKATIAWERKDHESARPPANASEAEQRTWRESEERLTRVIANLEAYAARQATFEAAVLRDLEKAHLTVRRIAAVYPVGSFTTEQEMNFINGESGTNANGQRFFIALGGDARAEKAFVAAMQEIGAVSRIYFLDRKLTRTTLAASGGIGCRVKAEGAD